jgi:prepilin-type N-terminal cleavage/methylation domain-containing protein
MPAAGARRAPGAAGFTLTELAVVLAIVALLLGGMMLTLSAQVEQRNFEENRRRLDQARELLLAFAIVKGRLPCPARYTSAASHSQGFESFCAAAPPATCAGAETTAEQTHGNCSNYWDGYLPAASIGWQQVDSSGFAIDVWGNRIRYAVARQLLNPSCTTAPPADTRLFTSASNLRTYGVSCRPDDLIVCRSSGGINWPAAPCGGQANQIMTQSLVAALVLSTGKNGSAGAAGNDEAANLNGNADPVFVWHEPTPSTAANGEFDDQMLWITAGELYGRMVAAGVLP